MDTTAVLARVAAERASLPDRTFSVWNEDHVSLALGLANGYEDVLAVVEAAARLAADVHLDGYEPHPGWAVWDEQSGYYECHWCAEGWWWTQGCEHKPDCPALAIDDALAEFAAG